MCSAEETKNEYYIDRTQWRRRSEGERRSQGKETAREGEGGEKVMYARGTLLQVISCTYCLYYTRVPVYTVVSPRASRAHPLAPTRDIYVIVPRKSKPSSTVCEYRSLRTTLLHHCITRVRTYIRTRWVAGPPLQCMYTCILHTTVALILYYFIRE